MALLNQNTEFKTLPENIRSAFSSSKGNKVYLPVGTSLYRFTAHDGISPWWSETSQLANALLAAKSSGQSLANYIRKSSAVLRGWSPDMFHLVIATLNEPVYAFCGSIAPQNEAAQYMNSKNLAEYKKKFTKPVYMSGGNGQVYLGPGVNANHLRIIVPVGTVNIYDGVDEILDFLISYRLV